MRDAALITGVAPGYFAGVLARNPEVAAHALTAAMPIGGSERDFELVRESFAAHRFSTIRTMGCFI